MLQSKYQRVGALAGLLMFFGAWLTAFYNHWVWATVTIVAVLATYWLSLEDETSEELKPRAIRGFVVGAVSGVVARILGLASMAWGFDSWSSPVTQKYDSLSDLFRVVLNGSFLASLVMIAGLGLVGAFVAYAMPYFTADREEE